MTSKRWSTTTKIIVSSILAVLAILLLITFRAMIQPTIIAFLLTFVLYQPVNWIQRRTTWSRGVSILVIYLVLIIGLLAAPVILVPRLVASFESLVAVLETLIADLQSAAIGPFFTIGSYELSADSLFQQLGDSLQGILSPAAAGALGFALTLTTTVLTTVYVLVLGFWLLKDMNKLQAVIISALPSEYGEEFRLLGQEIGEIWSAFLRGQFALAITVGVMTWVLMSIIGLPNAAGLALLAGVMEFLPTVGPGISGTVGVLVALFQGSTWLPVNNLAFALLVAGIYIVITQIESVYLIPRLVGRRVRLHPAVTFTGIISAALVFGVLGVLLITPTIASARVVLTYIVRRLQDVEPFKINRLHSEVRVPGLIAGHRIRAVIFDLDGTLAQLDWRLADDVAARLYHLEPIWNFEQRRAATQRVMKLLEGSVARWIGFLNWLQLYDDLQRMDPMLRRLQALPTGDNLSAQPGVKEILTELGPTYRLGLLTNRSCAEVEAFLSRADLPPHLFSAMITEEDLNGPAPQSDAFTLLLERLRVEPDQTLLVSDSGLNLRLAQALGAVQCGVLTGISTPQDLQETDMVIKSLPELREWL